MRILFFEKCIYVFYFSVTRLFFFLIYQKSAVRHAWYSVRACKYISAQTQGSGIGPTLYFLMEFDLHTVSKLNANGNS